MQIQHHPAKKVWKEGFYFTYYGHKCYHLALNSPNLNPAVEG